MKQKDVLLVVAVVIVSGTLSFFISKLLFTVPKNHETKVEIVQPISADFPQPDSHYFNTNSVDPTKNISIGSSQNTQPFSSQGQ
jgi:hypothetical protein